LPQFFELAVAALIAGFGDKSSSLVGVLACFASPAFAKKKSCLRQVIIG
jgi:hypothetical protein